MKESNNLLKGIVKDILLNPDESNLYNGHNQVCTKAHITLEEATELCKVVEEGLEELGNTCTAVASYHTDGSGSIKVLDYWKEGEHHLGHRDMTIFGWGSV